MLLIAHFWIVYDLEQFMPKHFSSALDLMKIKNYFY